MNHHEHVTTPDLEAHVADPGRVTVAEQVRLAVQLSMGCAECWAAADELPARDPRRTTDPLARALLRVQAPYYDLTLPNAHLNLVRRLRPGPDFARLVLEEDLLMGLQAPPEAREKHVLLAGRLLDALNVRARMGELGEPWKALNLGIRWIGAIAQLLGMCSEDRQAVVALLAEAEEKVVEGKALELPGHEERMIEMDLARLRLAEHAGRAEGSEHYIRYISRVDSWPQRFEIHAEIARLRASRTPLTFTDAVVPVLLGEGRLPDDELDRVNYLFHLARYLTDMGEDMRSRPGWRICEKNAAQVLEDNLEVITRHGDLASITLADELLAELHMEPLAESERDQGRRELGQVAAHLAQHDDEGAASESEEAIHALVS